jgi:predicted N-acetyltransferase YhbS
MLAKHPIDDQRRGLGSRLVRPILERADRDGVTRHLETADPASVPYYRRFGFEVVEPSLEVIPDDPSLTTMRRSPG